MDHPSIMVMGYSAAAMFLRGPQAAKVVAILSIHGAEEHGVQSAIEPRLDLEFDDVDAPDASDVIPSYHARMRRQAQESNGRRVLLPELDHARRIVMFALAIREHCGILLCHCGAGLSRSPAAALLCLATWEGPGSERECVDEIFRGRPFVHPHRDLIRFGDTLLGLQGRLLQEADRRWPSLKGLL